MQKIMLSLAKLKERFSAMPATEKISAGLDIGASAVKIASLKRLKDGAIELCGFDLQYAGEDLAGALKEIAQMGHLERVNTSVSGPSVIIRYTSFPNLSEDELKQALKFEAQKHIPFSITEVNLDSRILARDLADNKMLVLLAAAKKDFVNQRLKLLEDAGLKVNMLDIDSLALINGFSHNYSGEEDLKTRTVALLNIGASVSNLNILEDGTPRLSRDIYIGGNNFTQKIQETFNIDFKAAEGLKTNPDNARLDKIILAQEAVSSGLANELRVSFDYYESQSASSVSEIFLSGGGSLSRGLKEKLASLTGIKIDYWDPLKKINISGNVDAEKLRQSAVHLPVAIGLALRF